MLSKVSQLVREHRATPSFHRSEKNPNYLQLVLIEQALKSRLNELDTGSVGAAPTTTITPGSSTIPTASQQAGLQAGQIQQKKKQIQDAIKQKQKEIQDLQRAMNNPLATTMESRLRRRLKESELQQAQVVLAAQDMIDRVQKMLEEISEMQFKDLPALTDSIKNDMGVEQSTAFQSQAAAALTQLLASVQQGKTQLEAAQGTLTGKAPVVPGADTGLPGEELPGDELPGEELPGDDDIDAELDANLDIDADEKPKVGLGRERR